MGDDVVTGHAAAVEVLQELHLAGLQAACFAVDPVDISNLSIRRYTAHGARYTEDGAKDTAHGILVIYREPCAVSRAPFTHVRQGK